MSNKFAIDTADSPDVPVEETQEQPGQETEEQAKPNNEETPEETGQVSEEKETPEEPSEEKKEEPQKEGKKYSDQFPTLAAALKAAENLALALRDEVDFKTMTLDQVKSWYDTNRPRMGREGFRGNKEQVKKLNQDIKNEEDRIAKLETKFESFIETQKPKPESTKPKEPLPPEEPEFDEEAYHLLLTEDMTEAVKMRKDFNKRQQQYFKDLLYYEGSLLGRGLAPKFEEVNQIKEHYQKQTQKELEAEQERQNEKEWSDAEKKVVSFIQSQGDDDYNKHGKVMNQLVKENGHVYKAIAEKDGKERALFQLYQDAKKEELETEKEKRLRELEEENAALRTGKTIDEIKAAKGAARITQTNGGVTNKVPVKMTDQEKYEASMRGNAKNKNKFAIDY